MTELTSTLRKKIDELESLRGLSALAVLLSHLIYGIIDSANISSLPLFLLTSIGSFAHIAVLIFFVLSGFVIGYSHDEPFNGKNLSKYLLKRFIRIYPIYLLVVLLSFTTIKSGFVWQDFLSHLLFLQTWLSPVVSTNGPLWSLHFEVFFYLIFIVNWATNLELNKSIVMCALCGVLSVFIDFHILKILGYYSLWLMGLWLARNINRLPNLSYNNITHRFWMAITTSFTFGWANIYESIISIVKVKQASFIPTLPSILSDILISGLIVAMICAMMKRGSPFFKISLVLSFAGTIFSLLFAAIKGLFDTMINYKIALIYSFLVPIIYLLTKYTNFPNFQFASRFLLFFKPLGAISYCIYVIHSPIQIFFYDLFGVRYKPITDIYPWLVNLLIIFVVLLISWLLECCLQPILANRFRYHFIK